MELESAVEAFSALSQPTRLAVVRLLVRAGEDGLPAGEIGRAVAAPASTMSTHLAILTRAGLIRSRRESRSILYAIDLQGLRNVLAFLIEDCCDGRPEICEPLAEIMANAAACCATAA